MKKIFLLLISLSIVSFTIYVKDDFVKLLEKKLANFEVNDYPEKVYVQTDKPFYALDDNLWFSAYLVNGITHQKTNKSRVLHVELINPKDSIVAKRKLYVDDISIGGDFKINENWEAGNYRLRAYTNYMRNKGQNDFFTKNISIFSILKDSLSTFQNENTITPISENNKTKTPSSKSKLTFYPEGGYLVDGIQNKVAFKVENQNYSKVNLEGVIKDQDNNEVITFKTVDFGLGSFVLIPEKNKKYYACIYVDNKEIKYPLPKSLAKGYSLNITNTGLYIYVNVKSTLEKGLQNTFLVAHQRGHLLYKKYVNTTKNSYTIKISTADLKDGVSEFTLFDMNGNPIAERVAFIDNPNNNLKLDIVTDQKIGARKKVDIKVNLTDNKGANAYSTLSMAVRDLNAFPYNRRSNNIKTYLLLNSDLRGQVEDPGYFFEKENDAKRRYLLDLVMLTNGWRRFTWAELLNNDTKNTYQPEKGFFIEGTTKLLKKPYTKISAPTRLTFVGKTFKQEPIQQSDSLGKFKFGPYVFFDSIPVIIESRKDDFKSTSRKSRDMIILLDSKNNSPAINPQEKINTSFEEKEVANFKKVTQYMKEVEFTYNQEVEKLKEIELVAQRKSEEELREEEMDAMTDYGSPMMGQRMDITQETAVEGYTAFDMVTRMAGITFYGDSIFMSRSGRVPGIFLDGMEIEADFLRTIEATELSFVDLLIGPSDTVTFNNGGRGIIALYSNFGNISFNNRKRKPGVIDYQVKGFYTAREFYSPDHINGFEEMNKSDLRTTLYWNPSIKTSNKTPSTVTFFTSDILSDYIIEVEGISSNGTPIHGIQTFNVD